MAHVYRNGDSTVTTESRKNGAMTLSQKYCSGYVGHVTNAYTSVCCSAQELGLGLD